MERDPSRRTLNLQQAALEAGVSRRTLYNWIKSGKLDVIRTAGGSIRVYSDTLFRSVKKAAS